MGNNHIDLDDFELYQLARELSRKAWEIYDELHWQKKKTMGDQFISSTDSVGANIAEGYGRYHYKDRIRFLYYARGSLFECLFHWNDLLYERNMITKEVRNEFYNLGIRVKIKLNNFINSINKTIDNK